MQKTALYRFSLNYEQRKTEIKNTYNSLFIKYGKYQDKNKNL